MSRSVSVAAGAAVVAYFSYDGGDVEDQWQDFAEHIEDLRAALRRAFPSVMNDDRWLDREDHVIAGNRHASFGLSEYCGIVAVWIVPAIGALSRNWVAQIEDRFRQAASTVFGQAYACVGQASNGEAFYEPAVG